MMKMMMALILEDSSVQSVGMCQVNVNVVRMGSIEEFALCVNHQWVIIIVIDVESRFLI